MAIIVYLFTVIGSLAFGIFTEGYLGFFGNGDIGIINMAMFSASISVGVIAGKCLMSLSDHQFSFKAVFVAILCFAIPALALMTHFSFLTFPGIILTVALKWLYAIVFIIIGIIPSLIMNATFYIALLVFKTSEEFAAGILIIVFFVVPTIEGIILGEDIVDAVNPLRGTGADGYVEDENGHIHTIYFNR